MKKDDTALADVRRRIRLVEVRAVEGIRTVESRVNKAIDRARTEGKLPPRNKRGRQLKHAHPLPRRERLTWDEKDSRPEDFHEKHQAEYVIGCSLCYVREYVYFRNHPEARPVFNSAGESRRKRPWIDKGWEKDWKNELAEAAVGKISEKTGR